MSTPPSPSPSPSAPSSPQPAPPAWQAPGPGLPSYTSPIPVTPSHLGHAIAAEWTKMRSLRSTMWTLGVFVLIVVGIGLMVAALVAANTDEGDLGEDNPLSFGFFGLLLGAICLMTLGVLTTASEYGTGLVRTTMTACPNRGRVLAAKAIVFFTVSFVVTLVSTLLVAFMDVGMLDAREPTGAEWFKSTVGVSLYMALLGLLSLCVGSVIRHSAGAITIMIGVLLAPLVLALFMLADGMEKLRDAFFEYSIPSQLSVFYSTDSSAVTTSGPSGWDPLWIMLGVTAAVYAGALALLHQRDV